MVTSSEPLRPERLMHGTCRCAADDATADGGLRSPHLTDNGHVANYYADLAADECGCGRPVIVVADTSSVTLRYDRAAMDEPVVVGEDVRDEAWNRAWQQHPEWRLRDMVVIPDDQWVISLGAVGSVRADGHVPVVSVKNA